MRRTLSIIYVTGIAIFLSACGNANKFKPAEYISTSGSAQPGEETRIELADGAAIVVPANSLQEEINITVERNPEKINDLPPLSDNVVQLGEFYNYELDRELTGPVDLVLPFDESRIPEEQGVMVFGYPSEDGWKFTPVLPDEDKVTIYTDNVGDPLIAWHFVPDPQPVCDPKIALQVVPAENGFDIIGQVRPVDDNFFGIEKEPAKNIPVTLDLNLKGWRDASLGYSYQVTTEEQGNFQFSLSNDEVIEGWNWVFASAECNEWAFDFSVESKGYTEFKYVPVQAVAETEEAPDTVETPVTIEDEEEKTPEGAVMLPDFTGQTLDEAEDWLKENGFGYTWIDGSSYLDVGLIYSQAPSGGQYKVPHRTIVLLYHSIEKLPDRFGCDKPNLTSEEIINCGPHQFFMSYKTNSEACETGEGPNSWTIKFGDGTLLEPKCSWCEGGVPRIAPNTYQSTSANGVSTYTVVFHDWGLEVNTTLPQPHMTCQYWRTWERMDD